MNRRYMPLILMLSAGAVTCIITFVQNYSILDKLIALLVVLVLFYFLGNILKSTLDYFDKQNKAKEEEEKKAAEEAAKNNENAENGGEAVEEKKDN